MTIRQSARSERRELASSEREGRLRKRGMKFRNLLMLIRSSFRQADVFAFYRQAFGGPIGDSAFDVDEILESPVLKIPVCDASEPPRGTDERNFFAVLGQSVVFVEKILNGNVDRPHSVRGIIDTRRTDIDENIVVGIF